MLAECERLNEAYAAAFDTMIEHSRMMRDADSTRLKSAADYAWFDSECARLKLQGHKRRHAVSELSHAARS